MGTQKKQKNNDALREKTTLQDRYQIEEVKRQSGLTIEYQAYDKFREKKILIRELYPRNIVVRNPDDEKTVGCVQMYHEALFEKMKDRFIKKAKGLIKLYPVSGISNVITFFEENDTVYGVEELFTGITLEHILEKKAGHELGFEDVMALLDPVICALRVLHKAGISHGNIHPGEILVTREKEVILTGFLEPVEDSVADGTEGSLDRKAGYMPVERYVKDGEVGTHTDVYGIAAIIYRCIMGMEVPGFHERINEEKEVESPWEHHVELMESQSDALLNGLALYHFERYSSMEEFLTALNLEEFVADPESVSWFHIPLNFVEKERRSRREAAVAIVVMILILVWLIPKGIDFIKVKQVEHFYDRFVKEDLYGQCVMLDELSPGEKKTYLNDYQDAEAGKPEKLIYYDILTGRNVKSRDLDYENEFAAYLEIELRKNDMAWIVYTYRESSKTISVSLDEFMGTYTVQESESKKGVTTNEEEKQIGPKS